ncbi:hypothetical protein OKA04_16040 [Luteolibacter flavescens]|uniref:Serpin domain-containing protein n=1 Tax=Luteolibacter flavescens TaxID=1859460 RepID=A0ABT3FSR9_9BACT|nr:hypothetical protein [Luteolibacter flavescens]MCW1886249.1 hypothetical protein [Luteolibacter flavescens]
MKTIPLLLLAAVFPATAEIASVAHPEEKLPVAKTVVWTPLFQASWDKLNATHSGNPVKVEPSNSLISRLDSFTWDAEPVMPDGRWKTWAGTASEEFLTKVNAEAARMTGEAAGPFRLVNPGAGSLAVFGLLDRDVSFRKEFYRSRKVPLNFKAGDTQTKVKFFGVKGEKSGEFADTVRVLSYRPSEKSHALQMLCKESNDTVILFRPPAGAELDFATASKWLRTWREAWDKSSGKSRAQDDPWLHERDEIRVPYVKLVSMHDFSADLASPRHYKGQPLPRIIKRAEQMVKFELHERGARVRAEVSMSDDPFGGPIDKPLLFPRLFSYDAPFFVFLWRDGAEWPYFGTWVGDATALQDFR